MRNTAFESLLERIQKSELDSLLVGKQANIQYITGFTGDYGFATVKPHKPVLFTSPLYSEHAQSTVRDPFGIVEIKNDVFKTFADLGVSFWGRRVGYEAAATTCSDFEKLKTSLTDIELVPTEGMIEELRMVKKSSEIQSITNAQRITEEVFNEILACIKGGVQETDLACEIDYRFRKHGGERSAFDTIVAFGTNTSNPHAVSSKRKLKPGDIILFDMGTVSDGYASDMTRTVVFGKANRKLKNIYSIVLDAQKTALESIKSGEKCSKIDSLARNVIKKAGYGDQFLHSLGHGVGLEVHEMPRLSHSVDSALKKNTVLTVEPAVYIKGWGGVRIEDMVVVTDNGCENLTGVPKTLFEIQ